MRRQLRAPLLLFWLACPACAPPTEIELPDASPTPAESCSRADACAATSSDGGDDSAAQDAGAAQDARPVDASSRAGLHCDDEGRLIQDRWLDAEFLPGDRCALRIEVPSAGLDPYRLQVELERTTLLPDLEGLTGHPDYTIDGNLLRIQGRACELLSSKEERPGLISLRYGACRRFE